MNESDSKKISILIEQGSWLAKEVSEIKQDVKEIKKSHYLFKGKVLGAAAVVVFLSSLIIALFGK